METRIIKLEDFPQNTRDRLTRIETRMGLFATKADIGELASAMQKEINALTWKLVTFVCGFGTILVTATYYVATNFK